MIEAALRNLRHITSPFARPFAALMPRLDGGGCGIHFDAGTLQFVRLARVAGPSRLRLDAYGTAALDDDVLRGGVLAKPEAAARRLGELLERAGTSAESLRGDTVVLALPAHLLKTHVVEYPPDMPARALRAWCERHAALLLPGDGRPGLRSRVGVTWAEPGSHRLRLYACEAELVDDRLAALEMAGLRAHAVDVAHAAGRRAFQWAWPAMGEPAHETPISTQSPKSPQSPMALLQVSDHDIDLAVFDAQTCVADLRERFDGVNGNPEALASVVCELLGRMPVPAGSLHVAAQSVTPGAFVAMCDGLVSACRVPVRPFDPLGRLDAANAPARLRQTFAERASLAVACGLALRAMSMRGLPWQ
ncbi:pilus assembly protein PilM [Pandoraea norimbergensis]|uniref:Uncharacterized protein n=1 Tax=Pandoraea norimbergensis TaxID=93219 RepID=A0ABM5WGK8_9BURK|nr:pilus assembly protein PilM [Pandoraea norimbergensis]ALS59421.1 hypothetical protein AT302_06290 [Pandoraea norimbergensis]